MPFSSRPPRRARKEALLALARENGSSYREASGLVHLGRVDVPAGAIDESIQAILAGREMFKAAGECLAGNPGGGESGRFDFRISTRYESKFRK
jgi:hypothetical protein